MAKRVLGFVVLSLGLSMAGCGGPDKTAPCGESWCKSDEVCCITAPSTTVCVKGSSCPK